MLKTDTIRDLEKKYMDIIWKVVSSNVFLSDLKKIEKYIVDNYSDLDRNYQIKNKLQLAAERLLSFHIIDNLDIKKIYPSPISSDMAFFTDDSLINIDAKTIDLAGNRGDDNFIQFGPHQISFENEPLYKTKTENINFEGVLFSPALPDIEPETKLPCLTFFMGITYRDDGNSFMISHIKLSCIPNRKIVKEEFKNDIIQNLKTYRYLNEDAAKKLGQQYVPKPKSFKIPNSWLHFELNGVDVWQDSLLKNPFNKSELAIWRVVDEKYRICLGGSTARIKPEILKDRKDGQGKSWLGVREIKFII